MSISEISKFTMGCIDATVKFLPANARRSAGKAKPVFKIHQVLGGNAQDTILHIFSDGSARELYSGKYVRNRVFQFTNGTFTNMLKKYGSQNKFDKLNISDEAFSCFIRKSNVKASRNTHNSTIIKQGMSLNA